MAAATQDDKVGKITTALGADKLLLERFTANERLSTPFEIVAEVLTDEMVDFASQLGTGVSLEVAGDVLQARTFHGLLYEAEAMGLAKTGLRYRLKLRPRLHLLAHGRNSRIFQKKSAKEIITKVLNDAGLTDFAMEVERAGQVVREYCVQFRESDFDFISRLMEEEGIYYFFEHTADKHTLKLCDAVSQHPLLSGPVPVSRGISDILQDDHLNEWNRKVRPAVAKVTLRDSHFRKPGQPVEQTTQATDARTIETAEFYDYPGGYSYLTDLGDNGAGSRTDADKVLDAARADRETYYGKGRVFHLGAGMRIDVDDPVVGQKKFMIVSARHDFGPQSYGGEGEASGGRAEVEIDAVPIDTVWRPARLTPKPRASGPQTATVVGSVAVGPEPDEFGRIHVQFEWDREGKKDENSSCWVRVAQGWADGGFGMMHIPRVGEEVLVDFLDGDPDRPIVTGRVYNAEKKPPYTLPAEKAKSTWKSQRVGDAGSYDGAETSPSDKDGFNELRFDDNGGSEEIFIHAQRLYKRQVWLDESRKTERDVAVRVGRNREITVKKNETFTLEDGDETRTIKTGSRATTIEKSDDLTVSNGDFTMKVEQGSVTIEAMQKITFKVGQNTIELSQQGMKVKGMTVEVKADLTMKTEALQQEMSGSAMTTVKGALVKIN